MNCSTSRPVLSTLAFGSLMLCCAVMIVRPAEIVPSLDAVPFYELFIVGALVLGFPTLKWHFEWPHLKQQPALLCAVGVLIAVILSHGQRFYFYGMHEGATYFLKTLLLFGLLVSLTDTIHRLKVLLAVIAVCATFTVSLCLLDFYGVVDFELITHIRDVDGVTESNEMRLTSRMRGTGIFQDPNDISLLIVFSAATWGAVWCDRNLGAVRFTAAIPLSILLTGLLCTKSRGGLLAGVVSVMAFAVVRHGRKAAVAVGLLAACALPLLIVRQTGLGFDEGGTGHERITLWREGLYALRSPWLLFGIGQGMYGDWAGLVAHNSFVHAFVELGLFGGTLFLGCFFFPALSLYRLHQAQEELDHPELQRLLPFAAAMLAGWTFGLQGLSRTYIVSTYLMLGTIVAYLNIAAWHLQPRRLLVSWDRGHVWRLAGCSAALFVVLNAVVMVVGRG